METTLRFIEKGDYFCFLGSEEPHTIINTKGESPKRAVANITDFTYFACEEKHEDLPVFRMESYVRVVFRRQPTAQQVSSET